MKIVIYGLAKTGTSALFYKLKNSLPPDSFCLFEPVSFSRLSWLRTRVVGAIRGRQPPDVLAKLILFYSGRPVRVRDFAGFDKKLLLVRDPRDRLVSALLYWVYNSNFFGSDAAMSRYLDLLRRKEAEPSAIPLTGLITTFSELNGDSPTFTSWAAGYAERAVRLPLGFHDGQPDLHVFRYEDLVDGRFEELERYIGRPLTGAAKVADEVRRVERAKGYDTWRDWFTAEDVEALRPMLQPYLDRYYSDADWRLNEVPRIDPNHSSRYVERIVNEKRKMEGLPLFETSGASL